MDGHGGDGEGRKISFIATRKGEEVFGVEPHTPRALQGEIGAKVVAH